jgi:phosphate transport system substrate-binding protein
MQSWPITGASFILAGSRPEDLVRTKAVLRFFDWAFHNEETQLQDLGYAPLPRLVLDQFDALRAAVLGKEDPPQ